MDLEKMNKRESRAEQIEFGGNFSRLQTGVRLRRMRVFILRGAEISERGLVTKYERITNKENSPYIKTIGLLLATRMMKIIS